MEKWMKAHGTSSRTGEPLAHKMLLPDMMARQLIAACCDQNDVPVPSIPKPAAKQSAAGGGAAAAPFLPKPQVTCATHPKEHLRLFCRDCCRGVCLLCAVDTKRCKVHGTEALDTLFDELRADREGWEHVEQECRRGGEQRSPMPRCKPSALKLPRCSSRCVQQSMSAPLQKAPLCRSGRSVRSLWLVLLRPLRLQSQALPLQPSSHLHSTVRKRPFPPRLLPSLTLQLRPLQLWDTSLPHLQSLILRMKLQ
jgi:hypothetical protein